MIPEAMITEWKTPHAPWESNDFLEQDLILSCLLIKLYNNKISQSLAFKGGIALHKLFLPKSLRYSEDLDFDQISPEPIGELIEKIRKILDSELAGKSSYKKLIRCSLCVINMKLSFFLMPQ